MQSIKAGNRSDCLQNAWSLDDFEGLNDVSDLVCLIVADIEPTFHSFTNLHDILLEML